MRKKGKKTISFANIPWNDQPRGGDVLISSSLQPSTGGQGPDVCLNKGTLV